MLLGVATSASAAPATVTGDPLEPAKAAIRVKDYTRAIGVLTDLSGRGHAGGQYLLGTMHLAGLGTAQDPAQARQLFETAANAGDARAAYALAALYATGEEPDRPAAHRWLDRAAELGDPDAQALVRRQALPLEFRPHDLLTDESARRSALWRAAARDDVATLETLLDEDRVNAADGFGRTALHHAADAGAVGAMAVLLARGASIEATDHYGVTPLMLACGSERPEACTELLRAHASITAADRAGNTALVYALRRSRTQQAQALLAAGAAPVHVSVAAAHPAAADPGARAATDAYQGWPDIAVAASRKRPDDAARPVASGRRSERDDAGRRNGAAGRSRRGCAAIGCTAAAGRRGCLPSEPRGSTPLIVAVRLGREAALGALLTNGVDPNAHRNRSRLRCSSRSRPAMAGSSSSCWRPGPTPMPGVPETSSR